MQDWLAGLQSFVKYDNFPTFSFSVATATPLLARLKVGPLLKEITSKMSEAINRKKSVSQLKLLVYSAHDLNIANVLSALGIFNNMAPPYTSTIFMDLLYGEGRDDVNLFATL